MTERMWENLSRVAQERRALRALGRRLRDASLAAARLRKGDLRRGAAAAALLPVKPRERRGGGPQGGTA